MPCLHDVLIKPGRQSLMDTFFSNTPRAAIWVFFWLLKKFLGVSVSATSWSFLHPGHISLAVRTTNLELVRSRT